MINHVCKGAIMHCHVSKECFQFYASKYDQDFLNYHHWPNIRMEDIVLQFL